MTKEGTEVSDYDEGTRLLEEKFGNGRDNVIALATVGLNLSAHGTPRPIVRGVNACYEDGVFYVTTNSRSNKMQQIAKNPEVSISSSSEMFNASGTGENLGWVLDPQNAGLRTKLRRVFASWYDIANNEKDENCCILAIRLEKATLNINHWERLYHLDFLKRNTMESGGVY
jgi:hypothetical protein